MPPWAMDPRYMHHGSRAGSGKFFEFTLVTGVAYLYTMHTILIVYYIK